MSLKMTSYSKYQKPISVILLLVLLGGLFIYGTTKKSLFPDVTFPKVKIVVDNGLQPAHKMLVTVTRPMENAIKQVPYLKYVRSTTSRGSCEISAFLDWDANINTAQQHIESRINEIRADLPPNVHITVERMNPSTLPVMDYAVNSNTLSPIDLQQLTKYTIRPFLAQVPGVADVEMVGGQIKEYWVILDKEKMSALGISPTKITQVLKNTDFIQSNGFLADYNRLYLTVTDAMLTKKKDVSNIVISNNGKRIVLLKDISKVSVHPAIQYVNVVANGKPALVVGVRKQPNANLLTVSTGVKNKLKELKKVLPAGVNINPFYVQADFVHNSIRSVSDAIWVGILLAIIVAILFLKSWKASVTVLITIPITLALTLIVLYAVGYTLNIMTLGAIAASIGLIIDDAIVVTEQIHQIHEAHYNENSKTLVQKAIDFLFPAMLSSSASTIVIFIPFIFLSGIAGAFFTVLANTMMITLVCSFLVTWLGLPVIYLLFSKKKAASKKDFQEKQVKQLRWVAFFIRRPWISILYSLLLIGVIIEVIPRLNIGFLPQMDEGNIVLDYNSPPGTSLKATNQMLHQVDKIIESQPEVAGYSRRLGTQMGFFITEPNSGDYLIQLKGNRNRSTAQVIEAIRQKIENTLPALRVDFGQKIGDMLGDLLAAPQPIVIKIFGNDQQKLNALAKQVAAIADSVPGTADVFDGIVAAGPSIQIKPNFDRLALFGISPADFQAQLQTQLSGKVIGHMLEAQQMTPIRMITPHPLKSSLAKIKNTMIFLPNGKLMPIKQMATIQIGKGTTEIQRENLQTMSVVTGRLEGRSIVNVVRDIQNGIHQKIALPQGYHVVYGGQYKQQQKSFQELLTILIAACLMVFVVILFFSKDIWIALIILGIAVIGISGCFLALFLTGVELNVGSYTGIIMIVGIIGENSIFTYLQFKDTLTEKGVSASLVNAISIRLRPKLMTALGAIIALMPLALGIGVGAQMQQPLAIAVVGGFLAGLPLLLVVLPGFLNLRFRKKRNEPTDQ